MIDQIHGQYPHIARDQLRQLFADVAQEYLSAHELRDKELTLLTKFQHVEPTEKNE